MASSGLKVYGHPLSTCTRKVLCTLAEKEQKAELIVVDIMKGEQKSPAHLARHPWGQIPVLEDGDFRLYESRAICRYLEDRFSTGKSVAPKDIKQRALMEQWISVETSNVTPPMMKIIGQLLFSKMKGLEPDMKVVEEARETAARAFDILDKHFATNKYFVGDLFTIADISSLPYFEYLMGSSSKDLVESRKNLAAWWKRASERPSWQVAVGKGADAKKA